MAKKKKKKVNARKLLSRLHKKADKAISEYVRAVTNAEYGGKCPLCMRGPLIPNKPTKRDPRLEVPAVQCCFHFVRRKRKILRWDLRNLTGACHKCNWTEYRDPDPSRAWYLRKYGLEQYLAIVDESAKPFDPTVEYLQGIVDRFTNELECMRRFNEEPIIKDKTADET
jgi:hypothetical protein